MLNFRRVFIVVSMLLITVVSFSYERIKYIFDDGVYRKEVIVDKAPERAVTLAQFMTEMLLALGLEDKMVGTALLNEEILPEYKEAYDKIPVLQMGEGHSISKEAFISTEVDFVSGWEQSISEDGTGSLEELEARGVTPFISSGLAPDATIESVYGDFLLLGKIFEVEDRAKEIVKRMKKGVKEVTDKSSKIKKEDRVKVLIYDSGDSEAFVGGSGLPTNLVELAGGENIFKDLGQDYGLVSYESIVERNPDVIVVTEYYSGVSGDEKIKRLKEHSGIEEVNAIKNGRVYKIGLIELAPGIRNSRTVGKLYDMFYGK